MAGLYLKMAKMVELQLWDFYSDMRQFNCFPNEILKHIEYPMLKPDQIRDMDWKELGKYVPYLFDVYTEIVQNVSCVIDLMPQAIEQCSN